MICWNVGIEKGYSFSLGKNYKFLDTNISNELWKKILANILWVHIKKCGNL